MYDELTEVDIKKMQEEIDHRVRVLRPQLIEEVQTTRAFGDLSENYEYKCAKQAKNRNESRIRYLEPLILLLSSWFCFSRMSFSWNHTVSSPFILASFA